MARPESLIPGNCYFMVGFHDRDMLFPYISTLKYLRCEIDEERGRAWLFDEPNEPPEGEQESPAHESVWALRDDELYQVVDFPGLFEALREVSADHPLQAAPIGGPPLTARLPDELKEKIEIFLQDPQYVALSVTILFTDDGFSLGRCDGGFNMSFFPHPRHSPEEEGKIRALFANFGTTPHVDYLADKGRTRILEFSVPGELETLTSLCGRVLTEVHAMRAGDRLKYSFHKSADVA